jgi:hypothetical protein
MKGWVALAAGGFGLAAYVRRRRKQHDRAELAPADELRAKLAESRVDEPPVGEPLESAVPEPTPVPEPDREPDQLDDRRRGVHDRARAAIDDLG